MEGGDGAVGDAHSLHLVTHLHQLLSGGEGELRPFLPEPELQPKEASRGLRRDAGFLALCGLPVPIRYHIPLPGKDPARRLTDPAAQELEVQQFKYLVRHILHLGDGTVCRVNPAQRGVVRGLGHHVAVLCLFRQCGKRAQRDDTAPTAFQPDQPLEGSALSAVQAGQPLRQGIERGETLARLQAREQDGEFPIVLHLPFHSGVRRGPQPFPGIQDSIRVCWKLQCHISILVRIAQGYCKGLIHGSYPPSSCPGPASARTAQPPSGCSSPPAATCGRKAPRRPHGLPAAPGPRQRRPRPGR